jgi:hypothetical protein
VTGEFAVRGYKSSISVTPKAAVAAMKDASQLMADPTAAEERAKVIRDQLRKVLVDTDPFWLNWRAWWRSNGWSA